MTTEEEKQQGRENFIKLMEEELDRMGKDAVRLVQGQAYSVPPGPPVPWHKRMWWKYTRWPRRFPFAVSNFIRTMKHGDY